MSYKTDRCVLIIIKNNLGWLGCCYFMNYYKTKLCCKKENTEPRLLPTVTFCVSVVYVTVMIIIYRHQFLSSLAFCHSCTRVPLVRLCVYVYFEIALPVSTPLLRLLPGLTEFPRNLPSSTLLTAFRSYPHLHNDYLS